MKKITVQTIVNAPLQHVWDCWTKPEHIVGWVFASDDWEAPFAENDLKVGGVFTTRMAAKDGSSQFDFTGTYTRIEDQTLIEYVMSDGRQVVIEFKEVPEGVEVVETFDPEAENTPELQQDGWQSILNNFKKYAEKNN